MDKLVFVNPQWQGGGDLVTYNGAKEIENLYLSEYPYAEAPACRSTDLRVENGIVGYSAIKRQMLDALKLLDASSFSQIFAVGGGCDADVPVIAHLNKLCGGKLLVLWCDAHGDLNSPSESQTGLFYGMPARILMGESDLFTDIVERPLVPQQIIQIGGRDFDEAEKQFMTRNNICSFKHICLKEMRNVLNEKREWHIYIHLDLDVIDPLEFPNTPLPVRNGLAKEAVRELLAMVKKEYPFIGLGLYEYAPCRKFDEFLHSIVDTVMS